MKFYNDVNEWLSVGGDLDLARDLTGKHFDQTIRDLQAHGVTHVLDVRLEWDDRRSWEREGMPKVNYCYAPIDDMWGYEPPERWFLEVEEFVRRFLAERSEGDRLYVHCHMGINRAPSAAMLALLTSDPSLDPFDAFLAIRQARDVAGVVYAGPVGQRHLGNQREGDGEFEFLMSLAQYWTPELRHTVRQGIAYYRSAEGGTVAVDHQ